MLAKVSRARSVSRCRFFSRNCTCCTAIATGTRTVTSHGWPIASSASVAPSPTSPAAGHEPRVERLTSAHDVEQEGAHGQVDEGERTERDEVVEQMQTADVSTRDLERQAAETGGDRARRSRRMRRCGSPCRGRSLPPSTPAAATRAPAQGPSMMTAAICTTHGEPKAFPLHGLARTLLIRLLEQLHEDDRGEKEGKGRMSDAGDPRKRDSEHAEAEGDRDQG